MKKFKRFIGENFLLVGLVITAIVIWFIYGLLGVRIYNYEYGAFILCTLGSIYLGRLLGLLILEFSKWGDD